MTLEPTVVDEIEERLPFQEVIQTIIDLQRKAGRIP